MILPKSNSQSDEAFEAALAQGLDSVLSEQPTPTRWPRADRPPPASAPPVDPKAGAGAGLWGPSHPRITSPQQTVSPLQLLAEVADHAHRLNDDMLALVAAITGELPPAPRLRQPPLPGQGLLPAMATLAHEIEQAHVLTARLIGHVRGRL